MTPGRHAAADGSFRRSAGAAAGRGIVLLGVAVILGIVLLSATDAQPPGERVTAGRQAERPDDADVGGDDVTGQPQGEITTIPTPTTAPVRQPRDVKVLVANASGGKGVAGRITDQLRPAGYNLLAPGNASPYVDESSVLFTPGFESEAAVLASTLGLTPAAVKPMPTPPPLPTKGANVVVVVGRDLAAKVGTAPPATSTTARARAKASTTTSSSSTTSTTRQ